MSLTAPTRADLACEDCTRCLACGHTWCRDTETSPDDRVCPDCFPDAATTCPTCHGAGGGPVGTADAYGPADVVECDRCDGHGLVLPDRFDQPRWAVTR